MTASSHLISPSLSWQGSSENKCINMCDILRYYAGRWNRNSYRDTLHNSRWCWGLLECLYLPSLPLPSIHYQLFSIRCEMAVMQLCTPSSMAKFASIAIAISRAWGHCIMQYYHYWNIYLMVQFLTFLGQSSSVKGPQKLLGEYLQCERGVGLTYSSNALDKWVLPIF